MGSVRMQITNCDFYLSGVFSTFRKLAWNSAAQQRARMALKSRSNEEPETPVPSLKTSLVFCSL